MKNSIYNRKNISTICVLNSGEILEINGGESCHCWCEKAGYTLQVFSAEKCENFCVSVNDSMRYCAVFDEDDTYALRRYYRIGQPASGSLGASNLLKLGSKILK